MDKIVYYDGDSDRYVCENEATGELFDWIDAKVSKKELNDWFRTMGNIYNADFDVDENVLKECGIYLQSSKKAIKSDIKVYQEISFRNFEPWSDAVDVQRRIVEEGKEDEFEAYIADCYPEGIDATKLNDILRFDTDYIYEYLGIKGDDDEIASGCHGKNKKKGKKSVKSGYSNNADYVGDWFGKGQIDYSKIINPEDDGDIWMVKLWSGSGYVLDVYLVKADNFEDAMGKVFEWSYENEGRNELVFDYDYLHSQALADYNHYLKNPDSWDYGPYEKGMSEEEFVDAWIDEAFVWDDNSGLYARNENFFCDKVPQEYLSSGCHGKGKKKGKKEIKSSLEEALEKQMKERHLKLNPDGETPDLSAAVEYIEQNDDWYIGTDEEKARKWIRDTLTNSDDLVTSSAIKSSSEIDDYLKDCAEYDAQRGVPIGTFFEFKSLADEDGYYVGKADYDKYLNYYDDEMKIASSKESKNIK